MKFSVLRASDVTDELEQGWLRLLSTDPSLGSPYFHPAFTKVVSEVRDDVYVTLVEDGGRVVGFFPHQRGAFGIGRPVGGALSDYHGIICAPGSAIPGGELIRRSRLCSWTFDHCIASQETFRPFHRGTALSPVLDLSQGYEAFAAERRSAGSKQILKAEGLARKLERECGMLRFEAVSLDSELLHTCIAWKRAHYAEMGVFDVLGPPWTRLLLERIMRTRSEGFSGVLSTLWSGDRLLALHMGMRAGRVWHYWFPTYDREMARYSPGIILLLRMAASASQLGVSTIDLGKGATLYKDRLANSSIMLAEGAVELPSLVTALRRGRERCEALARRAPMRGVMRYPARVVRRTEKWLRFR